MIALRDVTLAVPGRTLVSNIRATIADGEFVAILGSNGVGKTTLLRAMSGLHAPASGIVEIGNAGIASMHALERAKLIAFVTSDDILGEALRVQDVVSLGRFPHHAWWQWRAGDDDEEIVSAALERVHMREFSQRLFSTLSSGERQRVWIAMGLAQATPVLLLDEPTSHLDVRVAHEILALLRTLAHEGRSIVCVLHDLNDAAAYADRLMLLGCEKLLAFDVPERVLTPELVKAAYGVSVERLETANGPRVFVRSTAS